MEHAHYVDSKFICTWCAHFSMRAHSIDLQLAACLTRALTRALTQAFEPYMRDHSYILEDPKYRLA